MELPDGAAQLTGARLQRGVHDRAAGAAVFGAERAGENLDLVDRVDRRLDDVSDAAEEVDVAGVVVDAVQQVVVLRRPHAVGREHQRRARAGLRRHDAGDQAGEHRIVAPVDREVFDRSGCQRLAGRAGAGLQERRLRRHDDLIGQAARLQREIDQRLLLDADRDAAPHRLLEALELDFDRVGASANGSEDVGAVLTRHPGERERLPFMRDGDGRAGEHAPARVFDRADDRAGIHLRTRGGGEQRQAEDQPGDPAQNSLDAHLSSLRRTRRAGPRDPMPSGSGSVAPSGEKVNHGFSLGFSLVPSPLTGGGMSQPRALPRQRVRDQLAALGPADREHDVLAAVDEIRHR
jgi:hypothetical protein